MENADRGSQKFSAAARSLSRWFQRESKITHDAIVIGKERLRQNPDDTETRNSVRQLEEQERALREGWRNSSLRQHMEHLRVDEDRRGRQGVEHRTIATAAENDIGASTTSKTRTVTRISGYAIKWGKPSVDMGYVEYIEPHAVDEAIKTSDIRILFNHNHDHILGRTSAATAELRANSIGLWFDAYVLAFDPLSYALGRRIDRGDVRGCSFSFSDVTDRWVLPSKPGERDKRYIRRIGTLYDCGPVTFPAYPATTVYAEFAEVTRSAEPRPAAAVKVVRPPRTISASRQRKLTERLEEVQRRIRIARYGWARLRK